MFRLGFSLVWFDLVWLIFLFEKNGGDYTGGEKNSIGKDLAGKRPSGEET